MRPPSPVPLTRDKSMPTSRAKRRTAGPAAISPPGLDGSWSATGCATRGATDGAGAADAGEMGCATGTGFAGVWGACGGVLAAFVGGGGAAVAGLAAADLAAGLAGAAAD